MWVFHNDVICFGAETVLVLHEYAFSQQTSLLKQLQERFFDLYQRSLEIVVISESMLSLDLAVSSYFFNSQLILLDTNHFLLLCQNLVKIMMLFNHVWRIFVLSHLISGRLFMLNWKKV